MQKLDQNFTNSLKKNILINTINAIKISYQKTNNLISHKKLFLNNYRR